MRIVSFNVNGVRASVGKGLLDTIKATGADIFCIQETKAQDDQVAKAMEEIKGDSTSFRIQPKKKDIQGLLYSVRKNR